MQDGTDSVALSTHTDGVNSATIVGPPGTYYSITTYVEDFTENSRTTYHFDGIFENANLSLASYSFQKVENRSSSLLSKTYWLTSLGPVNSGYSWALSSQGATKTITKTATGRVNYDYGVVTVQYSGVVTTQYGLGLPPNNEYMSYTMSLYDPSAGSGPFPLLDYLLTNEKGSTGISPGYQEAPPPLPDLDSLNQEAKAWVDGYNAVWGKADPLDVADGFIAGWAHSLTAGLSTRFRGWMYGDTATRNHKGTAFTVGTYVGIVHGMAMSFSNPCALSGGWRAAFNILEGAQFVGGAFNAVENLQAGNNNAALLDIIGMAGNLAAMRRACFTAEMELLTPTGWKRICDFKEGDFVLSCDENDPEGPILPKRVEEVFHTFARIWAVKVAGRVLRTTSEHPFYVHSKGWIAAGNLQAGDLLRSKNEGWVQVQEVCDTSENAPVYNMRVADWHTYFVGKQEWGWAVWAHNAEYDVATYGKKAANGEMHHGVLDAWAKNNIVGYISRAAHNIAIELSKLSHAATKAVFRQWLKLKYGKEVGVKVDWKNISAREVFDLSEKMFDAANVPKAARSEYYRKFTQYIYSFILGGK